MLKYTKLQFHHLFYMGLKLGILSSGCLGKMSTGDKTWT